LCKHGRIAFGDGGRDARIVDVKKLAAGRDAPGDGGPGCLRAPADSRTNAVNCADVPGAMVSGPLISTAE